MVDLQTNPNPSLMTCRFKDASETEGTTLVPGEGVKLIDLGASDFAGPPVVDERATNATDEIFGANIYNTQKNENVDGDIVQIARKGTVIFMNSGEAMNRGTKVELVLATPGNVVTQSTGKQFGTLLDKASAADELVRVMIERD
jgi:hypothetical protein